MLNGLDSEPEMQNEDMNVMFNFKTSNGRQNTKSKGFQSEMLSERERYLYCRNEND